MTITVFKKYPKSDEDQSGPKSYRLDHSDFGDVLRTVYAKGVITDFEKIADDPIEVKSMVKVTGDWGESEYIPIFFCPKEFYWDGPDEIKATDFNEEGKYFEKAWMSFRGGDEVIVMLQEGKPVTVMGFADGVPRIGENTFLLKAPGREGPQDGKSVIWDFQSCEEYYTGDYAEEEFYGPDGRRLQFVKVEPFHECEWDVSTAPEPGFGWPGQVLGMRQFLFHIGPFLCVLQLNYYRHEAEDYYTWAENVKLLYGISKPELAEQVIAYAQNNHDCSDFYLYFSAGPEYDFDKLFLYPDLLINHEEFWDEAWPSLYRDKAGMSGGHLHHLQYLDAEVFVRPHTKEELIEAEMWPKEE